MEDFGSEQYFVPKHFFGRDGHTRRKVSYFEPGCRGKNIVNTRCPNYRKNEPSPVTEVDDYFYPGYALGRDRGGQPLRDTMEGDDILECLETNAVQKVEEYDHYRAETVVHYDMPVIGHYINDTRQALTAQQFMPQCSGKKARLIVRNKTAEQVDWVFHQGKFLDPSVLYLKQIDSSSCIVFRPLGPVHSSPTYKDQRRLGRVSGSDRYRLAIASLLSKTETCNTSHKHRRPFVEIDLNEPCLISHIGLRALYPSWSRISSYPEINEEVEKEYDEARDAFAQRFHARRKHDRHGRRRHYPRLSYIREGNLSWVEQFEIQYRSLATKKWVPFRRTCEGNVDMTNEVVSDVDLSARFLRIYPKKWYQHCACEVHIYGVGTESQRGTAAHEAEQAQTVRYSVHLNQNLRERPDGAISSWKDTYSFGMLIRERKKYLQTTIKQDLDHYHRVEKSDPYHRKTRCDEHDEYDD